MQVYAPLATAKDHLEREDRDLAEKCARANGAVPSTSLRLQAFTLLDSHGVECNREDQGIQRKAILLRLPIHGQSQKGPQFFVAHTLSVVLFGHSMASLQSLS